MIPPLASLPPIPFRLVNRRGQSDHDPGSQRHHLLPRQVLRARCFDPLFDAVGRDVTGFDDFRRNGLLLPAREEAAIRMGLPLHRGPHRLYNELVMARVGQIEQGWSTLAPRSPEQASRHVAMQLSVLQRALRRKLLDPLGRRIRLNRMDPLGAKLDFAELDAMADTLWGATAP